MKKLLLLALVLTTLLSCTNNEDNPTQPEKEASYSMPDSLNFSVFTRKLVLNIQNEGEIAIDFKITNSNNHIVLSSSEGKITAGNNSEISVTVDKSNLPEGKSYSKLYFNINNKKDSVVVGITNFIEQKTMLTSDVVDAEYSKVTDQLVYVSANPSAINILTTSTGITESIPLLYVPSCVSISLDGKTAAVGHDAHISYINLSSKTIINTYSVSCYAYDIVVSNNKWAYVFPKEDQWEYIRCVNMNLPNDNENNQSGYQIYAKTRARLHPSGKSIYGANTTSSPSDIEKYDIQNGTAQYLYDSPYHGDYPMSGNIWFSEDGNRIFTRGKTVLKYSEIKEQDMLYNGTITTEPNYNIEWLDHSSIKNNLFLIESNGEWNSKNKPFVYVHNSTNLSFKNKLELEKFAVATSENNGQFYDAEPFFAFSNSSGKNVYVLVKATGAGLEKEWAIQKLTIE